MSVPDSEGGGLAEREFLFREVGIERWLNGLDLEGGQDTAAIIEKRRQKLEKKRRKRKNVIIDGSDDEMEKTPDRKKTLKYGPNGELQDVSDDDGSLSDSNTSDDDDPMPEAAGQIKIALFRVLASGEIKRGEYSPQFDAHDDDEESGGQNGSSSKDVDHTTSFAKPKTLDPKTISTQTVTGIDPTDKPYATFTFFYRGERQLQKMGILEVPKSEKTPTASKRRSGVPDLPSLGPLKKEGTIGFFNYRDTDVTPGRRKSKTRVKKEPDSMESDSDEEDGAADEVVGKMEDVDDVKPSDSNLLSPEDAERAGQVSEGIRKMKVRDLSADTRIDPITGNRVRLLNHRHGLRYFQLKRQHSAEPLNRDGNAGGDDSTGMRKSSKSGTASPGTGASGSPAIKAEDDTNTPNGTGAESITGPGAFGTSVEGVKKNGDDEFSVGSPFKRQRSSMADFDSGLKERLAGSGLAQASSSINEIVGGDGSAMNTNAIPAFTGLDSGNPGPVFSGIKFGGSLLKKQDDNDDEL